MKHLIEEAFRNAILTEKKSYDFYKKMAESVQENRLKDLFHKLAEEEAEHMKSFVLRYPGDEYDLLALVESRSAIDSPAYRSFFASAHTGLDERKALEISLYEELECINYYSTFVTCINEPGLRSLFEFAIDDSRKHFNRIYEEYLRISGDHATDLSSLLHINSNHFPEQMPKEILQH